LPAVSMIPTANKRCEKRPSYYIKKIILASIVLLV